VSVLLIVLLATVRAPYAAQRTSTGNSLATTGTLAFDTFFLGIGTMSFSFVVHQSSFPVFNSLRHNGRATAQRWRAVLHISIGTALTGCMILAVTTYAVFGQRTRGDVLNNFSATDGAITLARFLLVGTMCSTHPMEHFVCRQALYRVLYRSGDSSSSKSSEPTTTQHVALTLCIWGLSVVLGLYMTELGPVLELSGGVSAAMLGYILPVACHFRLSCGALSYAQLWRRALFAWWVASPHYVRRGGTAARCRVLAAVLVPSAPRVLGELLLTVSTFSPRIVAD
jgi:sodium-coupled neutral amino acid transporter 11